MAKKSDDPSPNRHTIPEILRSLSHKFREIIHGEKEKPDRKKKQKPFQK